jgi:thiol-disulfide isomerase/thioredoxin
MSPVAAAAVVLALVAVAAVAGLLWRRSSGRVRTTTPGPSVPAVASEDLGAARLGERATLLQLSTEYCAPCRSTARVLTAIAAERPGVTHVEVDLGDRPDLARRFGVLQTPTTLLLDSTGAVRARIAGAARPAEASRAVERLLGSDHVTS